MGKLRPFKRRRDPVVSLISRMKINPNTDCWEWTGGKKKTGYGLFRLDGRITIVKENK